MLALSTTLETTDLTLNARKQEPKIKKMKKKKKESETAANLIYLSNDFGLIYQSTFDSKRGVVFGFAGMERLRVASFTILD